MFWIYTQLLEEILPINYYSELSGVCVDTEVVKEFLRMNNQMDSFLIKSNFNIDNFINKWLITLFSENFDPELTNLIWDFLFLEGSIVLIKTCITIFLILREKYLSFTEDDFGDFFMVLSEDIKKIPWNHKDIIYSLTFKRFKFVKRDLILERDKFTERVEKRINENNIKNYQNTLKIKKEKEEKETNKKLGKNKPNIFCNPKWPTCNMKEEGPKLVIKYLVFTENFSFDDPNKVHENYFFKDVHRVAKSKESEKRKCSLTFGSFDNVSTNESAITWLDSSREKIEPEEDCFNIMIERSPHFCKNQDQEDDK